MNEVNFYRGPKNSYRKELYPNGIYFTTDTKEIIVNDISYGTVDFKVDNTLTPTSTNPVTAAGIYSGVQKQIDNALIGGDIPYKIQIREEGNNEYRLYLLNKNGDVISQTDSTILGEQSSDIQLGGVIFNLNDAQDKQIKIGETGSFLFYYDRRNDDGYSTATKAVVRVYKGSETVIDEFEVESNSNFTVAISDEMASTESKTQFFVKLTPIEEGVELTEETKSIPVSLLVIDFTLVLNGYQLTNSYRVGDNISIPYRFTGYSGEKTVRVYVDGVREDSNGNVLYPEQVTTEGDTFVVPTSGWSEGTHSIQIQAFYKTNTGETIYSNLIYIAVPIKGSVESFGTIFDLDIETPLAAGQLPTLQVQQYQSFSFDFIAMDNKNSRVAELYSDGTLVSDYLITTNTVTVNYKYSEVGTKLCKLKCGNQEFIFNIEVLRSNYSIFAPSNPDLYLSALGKSNSSNSKNIWEYKNITSNFEGFKWGTDGWQSVAISDKIQEPALRLIPGNKVTVNYKPLQAGGNDAFAFNIKFKVSQAVNDSEILVSCLDKNDRGFVIKTNEAYFRTYEGNTVSTKFAAGEVYNIGFVSYPELTGSDESSKLNSRRIYLYVNGVICSTTYKTSTDSIYQTNPENIILQANNSILDVFFIRAFGQQLSDGQMFDLYLTDLNNPELLEKEYSSNQVLNNSGNIDVQQALKCGLPCMIITGQYEGLDAVDYVAAMNDKDPKYDIDEILYLESEKASPKNFLVVKGESAPQLRLQGTSSLNYAIKNYRIYSKKAKLFLNCDLSTMNKSLNEISELETQGVYVPESKPNYSLHENSAPVNCWCLKADFAEASSSHNTGYARMVHDLFTNEKVNSLTPPQYYGKDKHSSEIRTTIDGHPCLLFARKTTSDTPVFAGKFNFNNDKSTEDVFGFLNIKGYHKDSDFVEAMATEANESLIFPSEDFTVTVKEKNKEGKEVDVTYTKQDILDLLEGNPTECWEFLNNENEFGDFKNVDFDALITTTKTEKDEQGNEITKTETSLKWLNMWEARFPDEDLLNAAFEAGVKPKYLKATAEWIMSTDPEEATGNNIPTQYGFSKDTAEYRRAKFVNELKYYFNLDFLCDYYTLNDSVAGADQRKKNMMWAYWYDPNVEEHPVMGRTRCYIIYYDNDTILGVDNSGAITIPWDADENTKTTSGSYVFAGHNSVLWNNLRTCFSKELKDSYRKLREVMDDTYMKSYFNEKQSDVYGEVVFNKDTYYKYIKPTIIGTKALQGGAISNKLWPSQAAFVHGTRKAHRDWFIGKRMSLFDNRYATKTFTGNYVAFKGPISEDLGLPYFSLVSAKDSYYAVYSDMGWKVDDTHTRVGAGETWGKEAEAIPGPGATTQIYGIDNVKELNIGTWGGFNFLQLGNFPLLEKFILGDANTTSVKVIPLIGSNMPLLKYLDVTNTEGNAEANPPALFTSLDVSENINLETIIARKCPYLTTINFAPGGVIKSVVLPTNYSNLYLESLPELNNSGIQWETSAANVQRLYIDNCPKIKPIELLNSIMQSSNNLTHIRITNVKLEGNGQDLIAIMNRGIKGLNSSKNPIDSCAITGQYKLTTLLDVAMYDRLCTYFPELDIQQPKYTHVVFDYKTVSPEKITNKDNNTGYGTSNVYEPSGHISRILEQRYSGMVKLADGETGEFNVMKLSNTSSYQYNDGGAALLNGSEGDYCMYEPHYWYKGVNDHMNQKIHLFISSEKEMPTSSKATIVKASECVLYSGKHISTAYKTLDKCIITDSSHNAYYYELPKEHNYKQFRVCSTTKSSVGAIVVDASGNVLTKLSATAAQGMYETAYLFGTLPEGASGIYLSMNISYITEKCLYLIESEDIEAIEPEWVEHKECFVGRLLSTITDGQVLSAYLPTYNNIWGTSDWYAETNISCSEVCSLLKTRGIGYYFPMGYETYKDIMLLSYLTYGTTALHISKVGAGVDDVGNWPSYSRYIIDGKDYFRMGLQDTKVDSEINYSSYQVDQTNKSLYPQIVTLLGYHQFIGGGTTISLDDEINVSQMIYRQYKDNGDSKELVRQLKIYSPTTAQHNKFIIGGKYFDLFGTSTFAGNKGTASDGFCGDEVIGNTNGYLSVGKRIKDPVAAVSYSLKATSNNPTTEVNYSTMNNLVRVMIVPNKITEFTNSELYKNS